jgi:hypothetical protein
LASLICAAGEGLFVRVAFSFLRKPCRLKGALNRNSLFVGHCNRMTQRNSTIPQPHHLVALLTDDAPPTSAARIGTQPIALAAGILLVILACAGSVALWRSYTGTSPEPDRVAVARQFQARAAQVASEQLVEKTKGLEATQQESIDQLQVVQDQLQTVRRLLAAQQAESKRLSDQVAALNEAVDGLRQSFASAQANESSPQGTRSIRMRAHAVRTYQKRIQNARLKRDG